MSHGALFHKALGVLQLASKISVQVACCVMNTFVGERLQCPNHHVQATMLYDDFTYAISDRYGCQELATKFLYHNGLLMSGTSSHD
mmetsp:Transcript_27112/g.78658  ORF Transcript_27112/g.78658 Transcript_27112/m.78658 type:complete len:86 (+) Transcript_27112:615-872(+)